VPCCNVKEEGSGLTLEVLTGLQAYASTSGYGEGFGQEAVTKVWVLMGGEGLQRQHSLRSGLHACLMLQDNSELQVCVCSPVDASISCWLALDDDAALFMAAVFVGTCHCCCSCACHDFF